MNILQLEQAITARLAAAFTLPGQAHPRIEVRAWPDDPRDYRSAHPKGAALVVYRGTEFDHGATAGQRIAYLERFEVSLFARTLREANVVTKRPSAGNPPAAEPPQGGRVPLGGGEGANSKATLCPPKPEPLRGDVEVSDSLAAGKAGANVGGIYELVDACRAALAGWTVPGAAGQVQFVGVDFSDYVEGTWQYTLRIAVPMVTVIDRPRPAGPWAVADEDAAPALKNPDFQ